MRLVFATIIYSPEGFRNIHHICGNAVSMEGKLIYFFTFSIVFCDAKFLVLVLCSQIYQVLLLDFESEDNIFYPQPVKEFIHFFPHNVCGFLF